MILPASKEEGKLIKKRYAVFNFDGSLAELKGFEIKRRGELKLIKAEVFEQFLAGSSLAECYAAGVDLSDSELLGYISEATTMSKGMDEYEGRKSCAITTAKRLAQFLGDERIKDKGLNCTYVIARKPESAPTSERAIPVSIFSAEPAVARAWVRKWCGDVGSAPATAVPDVRDIVDWQYYRERLGSAVQKIITIPAAMQHVANPVPRVKHPDWLHKRVRERDSKSQQLRLDTMFAEQREKQARAKAAAAAAGGGGGGGVGDIEDLLGGGGKAAGNATVARVRRTARDAGAGGADQDEDDGGDGGGDEAAAARRLSSGGEAGPRGARGKQHRQEQEQQQAAAAPRPDRRADYRAWVTWQKQKWRAVRQERKRRKTEAAKRPAAADDEPAALAPTGNVARFFRQQQARAAASHWQLLQLAPTAVPGTFRAWVLVDAALYAVPLRVARTLYVDAATPPDAPESVVLGTPVRVSLPYGRTAQHVYRLSVPEPDWQARHARLALQLLSAGASGVYEGQMPLRLQAALQLGCVATVAPAARGRPLGDGFDLEELQYADTARCGFLEGDGPEGLGPLRYIALVHSADPGRGRGVYALLLPATGRGLLVVVQPSALAAREVTPGALERAWRDGTAVLAPQGHNTQEQVDALARVEWAVDYCADGIEAARALQRAILNYREAQRGPLLVAVQCPGGAERMAADVPLLGEFPVVSVPALAEDSRYPALQWQLRAARRAVHRAAVAGGWLRERAALTRYAHVPLADLGGDPSLAIADALYARCLRASGHALWVRDPALPDPGVEPLPDDDAFLLEDLPSGEVSCPGAYRTVCVHLRLHHLAVAALVKAQELAEMEGASGLEGLGAGAPAFGVLRRLVESWLTDATRNGNPIADRLLHNLYRWVSNPAGRLHDGGLQRALLGLMQRMFLALVADMRRLGAQLVSANFGGVLICTGKRNMSAAVGYVRYLLDTLAKRDLFSWLTLAPSRWWHALLYRDAYNFGGVEAALPEGLWEATERGAGGGGGGEAPDLSSLDAVDPTQIGTPGGPKLSCLWNLREFLPPALQEHLVLLLAEFVYRPWKEAAAAALRGASQGGSQAVADAQQAQDVQIEYLSRELGGSWGDRLMTKVQAFAAKCPPGSSHPECQFPVLAGSHLSEDELGSPALAFVRTACHLLALDAAVTDEVALLRRRLLKLLGVGEFGSAAQFREPCMSFRLPDVICGYCNDCRDLDLCRDPELQAGQRWACAACAQPYDMPAIEARLVKLLGARVREYVLQDLQCVKCKQVATEHLCGSCKQCGGSLTNTIRPDVARKRLVVFRNLAAYHKFDLLQQLADDALGRV
ncbi:hypothetical protein Rsub_05251 [Raphidocelis subcapitata]|uniref:DNA polymerase epsilon catalytic subunit n=1 Tax=Raphidocelis subcapitata TaxID=307507 RepID=A0A2V0P631_9CHLO|nr:hypothetical protein Rsub_05251 [Raphidocelis subcapitata]|eukprot:GBF92637.1 hypothetical protein Rsub_05251 [Raphidocelis subcapitata]